VSREAGGSPLSLAGSPDLLIEETLLVLVPLGQPPQPVLPQPGNTYKHKIQVHTSTYKYTRWTSFITDSKKNSRQYSGRSKT